MRVSDEVRKPQAGFDYGDCETLKGDKVAHEITWQGKSLEALAGRTIRLEFQLRDADLSTFRTGDEG